MLNILIGALLLTFPCPLRRAFGRDTLYIHGIPRDTRFPCPLRRAFGRDTHGEQEMWPDGLVSRFHALFVGRSVATTVSVTEVAGKGLVLVSMPSSSGVRSRRSSRKLLWPIIGSRFHALFVGRSVATPRLLHPSPEYPRF